MAKVVDDTFIIQQEKHSQQLLQHIKSQDPHIQFTTEELNQEGALPFLDTLVSPGPNNTLVTTVYRKPTHTNQYLHWDSSHFITAKNSVFNTLAFRAKVVSSDQHTLNRKWITSEKPFLHVIFHHGPSTVYSPNSTTNTMHKQSPRTNTTTPTTKDPATKTFPLWYLTQKHLGKSSRRTATAWASRYTSKAITPSELFS